MQLRILIASLFFAAPSYAECYKLGEVVSVPGYLVEATLPGPPEFEDTSTGDKPLTIQFLYNREGICVSGLPGSYQMIQATCRIGVPGRQYNALGVLFNSHTGYHWSPLLIDCGK